MAPNVVIVFDCDGVLLDSNRMKTDAFADVLRSYGPEPVDAFLTYQRGAFGTSRYRLIDNFFADFLHRAPADSEREDLLAAFGDYCRLNYPLQSLTAGALDVLDRLRQSGVDLFVCSGSDESELQTSLQQIGIADYFVSIHGSPATKVEGLTAIRETIAATGQADRPILFVGDAEADWTAAKTVGARFVYMSRYSSAPERMSALAREAGFEAIEILPQLLDRGLVELAGAEGSCA